MERSLIYTALLETPFARAPDDRGATVTACLRAWHASPLKDMWAFCRAWAAGCYATAPYPATAPYAVRAAYVAGELHGMLQRYPQLATARQELLQLVG